MFRPFIFASMLLLVFALAGCGGKSRDELHAEGLKLLQGDNPGGAIVLFKNALEKDPNFQDARFQLAVAYQAVGKYEQAEKEFLKIRKQNPSRADILLELAKLYNALDKPDQAIEQSNAFLAVTPGSVEAHETLGTSYGLKGALNEAERHLRQVLEREPARISAKLQLAGLILRGGAGRENEAIALINEIIAADSRNAKAYYLLASHELSRGNQERALEIYRTIATITPADPTPFYRQGIIHLEKGQLDLADRVAGTLLQKFDGHSEGHRLKGLIAYQRKNYAEAITALQNSVKISPSLEGLYYLGLSMYGRGELENALSQFRRILDHKSDFAQARILTALVLLNQKRIDDAISEANRVIEADDRNALAHNILGSAFLAKGMYDEAVRELNRAIVLDPKIVDAHLKKGIYNLSKGRVNEAESDFNTAVRVAPDVLNSRLVLSFHHLRQSRPDRALATLKEGISGRKEDAPLYNTMAAIMFSERKQAEGAGYLQKAKEIDPAFLPARFNLATYYAANGDFNRATGEYNQIVQGNPGNLKAMLGMAALSELNGKDSDALGWYTRARETGEYAGYLALASYHEKKGNHDKAIAVLDEAIKVRSRTTDAYVMKGRILLARKQGKEAVRTFTDLESVAPEQGLTLKVAALVQMKETARALDEARRAVTFKPNSAFGHTLAATVYATQGDYSRAIQEVRNGLRVEPENMRAAMQLGELLGRSGNTAAAMAEYDRILKASPDHAPALFAQGMLLESSGKKAEAIVKYRQTLQKSDSYVPALNNLAYLYAEGFGPRKEALRLALTALKHEPGNAAIADTYGYALLMNGRKEDALKVLEEVVTQLPDNPSIRYHLALAYRETGNRPKAAAALQQALKQGEFPESIQARRMLAELSGGADSGRTGRN